MSDADIALLKKLEQLDARFSELDAMLSDPEIASDVAKVVPLSKEQGKLRPTVSKYRNYKDLSRQLAEAEAICSDKTADAELKELAEAEIEELFPKKDKLFEEIKDSFVMADDASIGSVIVEIRAGTGGDEAALFARDLYEMYQRYSDKQGWKNEMLDFSASELGGFREVVINIKGSGVWSHLGYEGGGHRVQRVPETETQGRVHTSAVTVAVLPEPEEVDMKIAPADVVEHVSRAGGPGGQSVNKLNSAIKLEHKPTGITVSMRDEKSQHKNRAKAWRILRTRVYEHYQSIERKAREQQRKTMIGSGDRSERVRTYNFPQNRVTDHRINLSLYSLDKVMAGEMDELVAGLIEYDKKLRLENL